MYVSNASFKFVGSKKSATLELTSNLLAEGHNIITVSKRFALTETYNLESP